MGVSASGCVCAELGVCNVYYWQCLCAYVAHAALSIAHHLMAVHVQYMRTSWQYKCSMLLTHHALPLQACNEYGKPAMHCARGRVVLWMSHMRIGNFASSPE